jgi:putative tricarboxylic transport membrane protein
MDFSSNIALGFSTAFQPVNFGVVAFGVTLGTLAGVLPGVGAITAISILLPLTFYMEPSTAIIMLAGIYYGAQYGGSQASILMNLPGTSTHAVTCLDGYPLSKQGRAGPAMFIAGLSSFIGGSFAILLMMILGPWLAEAALEFKSAEYVAVMVFGLVGASTLSAGSPLKGLAMVAFGVVIGLVGIDITSGLYRFNFGFLELSDGLNLVAVAMGLFGVAEILVNLMKGVSAPFTAQSIKLRSILPTWDDIRRSTLPTGRAMVIGAWCGILPGVGPTIASFMAYAAEKRISKNPERFGTGAIEGVAAPESANNASVQSAFIPTLSLGVPGDAMGAVLLGALMLHGIAPGPSIVTQQAVLYWGLIGSFWIGNVLLVFLNIPLIGVWVNVLRIPYNALYPAMLFFISIGVYSINYNVFDIFIVVIFGMVGAVMLVLKFPAAPLLLGFILGPMIEENLRRAMLVSRGSLSILVESGISASFVAATVLVLIFSMRSTITAAFIRARSGPKAAPAKADQPPHDVVED